MSHPKVPSQTATGPRRSNTCTPNHGPIAKASEAHRVQAHVGACLRRRCHLGNICRTCGQQNHFSNGPDNNGCGHGCGAATKGESAKSKTNQQRA